MTTIWIILAFRSRGEFEMDLLQVKITGKTIRIWWLREIKKSKNTTFMKIYVFFSMIQNFSVLRLLSQSNINTFQMPCTEKRFC